MELLKKSILYSCTVFISPWAAVDQISFSTEPDFGISLFPNHAQCKRRILVVAMARNLGHARALDMASKSNITLHSTSMFRDFSMGTDLKSSVIRECNKKSRFFTANFLVTSEI